MSVSKLFIESLPSVCWVLKPKYKVPNIPPNNIAHPKPLFMHFPIVTICLHFETVYEIMPSQDGCQFSQHVSTSTPFNWRTLPELDKMSRIGYARFSYDQSLELQIEKVAFCYDKSSMKNDRSSAEPKKQPSATSLLRQRLAAIFAHHLSNDWWFFALCAFANRVSISWADWLQFL